MMSDKEGSCVYNELRLMGKYCDAVIKVEDAEFQIHRIILSNCSTYFRALFEHWLTKDRKVFDIPDLSPDMMHLIIEFAYTDSVSVTEDNVRDLILAADTLSVTGIRQICFNFLSEHLCSENCVGIWQFTHVNFSSELRHKAFCHIIDHFEEVARCEQFLQFSELELVQILGRDDLIVKYERTVYESILRWISHAPEERERHITLLLSKVRLALTSIQYIRINVMSNELVTNNAVCLQMANDAIQIIFRYITDRHPVLSFCNPIARPRLPHAILLAIGGWNRSCPSNGIEAYDFRTNLWVNVTNNLERPRAYHGAVFLNSDVYCVGGFDGEEFFSSARRFDLSSHTWHEVAPMHHSRCYVSVTVLNGCIYAMGGHDGHRRHSSAERYRPETNQWSLIASMHEQRSDASCTTLYDKIYICGGFNGTEYLQTAEYYDQKTNQWTIMTPMGNRRSGVGVIAYEDRIYAVGGFNGTRLSTVERFNPLTNTWNPVPNMMITRSNFGLEVLDGRLFVVGGYNGVGTDCTVEYYDASTNEWAEACDMEISRSALSCCVVFGLSNMAEYAFPRDALPYAHLDEAALVPLSSSARN